MTHGAPDNFNTNPRPTTFTLSDDAELAVRQGSISSIDRLGDIIYIDSYENGLLQWETETGGLGESIGLSTKSSDHGGFTVEHIIPANPLAYTKLFKRFPYPVASKIGMEFHSTTHEYSAIAVYQAIFYTGSYKIHFAIKYDAVAGKAYLLNHLGVWVEVTSNFFAYPSSKLFHKIKAVVDLPNLKYSRYKVPSGSIDISSYSPLITADVTLLHMYVDTILYGSASGEITVYGDSVIITQNEP